MAADAGSLGLWHERRMMAVMRMVVGLASDGFRLVLARLISRAYTMP